MNSLFALILVKAFKDVLWRTLQATKTRCLIILLSYNAAFLKKKKKIALQNGTLCNWRRGRVLISCITSRMKLGLCSFYDPFLPIWKASNRHNDYCYTIDRRPVTPNLSVASMAKAWGSGDCGSVAFNLRLGLTGVTALPRCTEKLFLALLSVVGDGEQLMERKASRLKLGLACREQKVFTTHEFAEKGNGQHGRLGLGGREGVGGGLTDLLS